MAKYSPIGPLLILQNLVRSNLLDDYLLVLAHDVDEQRSEYLGVIYDAMGDNGFLILDNSVIELGKPMEAAKLIDIGQHICADCIVLPDAMGDMLETVRLASEFMDALQKESCSIQPMKIIQGPTWTSIRTCIHWMNKNIPGNIWGVPRWITNKFGSRAGVINIINSLDNEGNSPHIHLLGMSQDIKDDIECGHMSNVKGIDSANPLVLGQMHIRFKVEHYQHMDRGTYWDSVHPTVATQNNIEEVRRLFE